MIKQFTEIRLVKKFQLVWDKCAKKHPTITQFIVFFMISNGITVLQLIMMPLFKIIFNTTSLVNVSFQVGQIGRNFDGSDYYIFNYTAGSLLHGGGGGLAYFLAIELSLGIAQVVNFFAQRNVTFKSKSNIWKAAIWYLIAYLSITILGAALQGLYKAPIYRLFIETWNMGGSGETFADLISMLINCAISFWVYFPILKFIFKK